MTVDVGERSPSVGRRVVVVGVSVVALVGASLLGVAIGRDDGTGRPAEEASAATTTGLDGAIVPTAPGAVDVGFSRDMSIHHQQAVLMARAVRDTASPGIRAIADQVAFAQLQEIGLMGGWLRLWGVPQLASGPPMQWMGGHGHGADEVADDTGSDDETGAEDAVPMPGLATQGELDQLSTRTGTDLDVWFLQLMIRHHQGGLIMAADAAEHAETPQVRDLATSIIGEQQQELQSMLLLLDQLGGEPLPEPAA